MYKEIAEMNKGELAGLVALTRKDLKDTPQNLAEKYTDVGLKLELWKWITGKEYEALGVYKGKEFEAIKNIAKMRGCEKSLSLEKTEEKIAEKVLLEIVKNLTPGERENLAEVLEKKKDLAEDDIKKIKNLLFDRAKSLEFPLLLSVILPHIVEVYPPLSTKPLFMEIILGVIQKWKSHIEKRKFVLGIIVAFCVMKRLEKESSG